MTGHAHWCCVHQNITGLDRSAKHLPRTREPEHACLHARTEQFCAYQHIPEIFGLLDSSGTYREDRRTLHGGRGGHCSCRTPRAEQDNAASAEIRACLVTERPRKPLDIGVVADERAILLTDDRVHRCNGASEGVDSIE